MAEQMSTTETLSFPPQNRSEMKTWLTAELQERSFKNQSSARPRPEIGSEQRVVDEG